MDYSYEMFLSIIIIRCSSENYFLMLVCQNNLQRLCKVMVFSLMQCLRQKKGACLSGVAWVLKFCN